MGNTADKPYNPDANVYFNKLMVEINQQLITYFTPKPEPDPWVNTLVNDITDLIFVGGTTLQVKERNYGANPEFNKWVSWVTGFTGDFGTPEHEWAAFAAKYNVDSVKLLALFNSFLK